MESEFTRLPSELTEEILARVRGVLQIVRLRLVCRAWNCRIQSRSFAALHSQMATPEPWLVTIRRVSPPNQKLYFCDRSMQRWVLSPLQFLSEFNCDFTTCKSAGGLVCCVATAVKLREHKSILVFNPITKACKLLPSPPIEVNWWGAKVEMAMSREESTGDFKVALCGDGEGRCLSVYDSRRGRWEEREMPQRETGGAMPRMAGYRNGMKEVRWYEVGADRWREAELPETEPLELRNPVVIHAESGGGRVLLAGVLGRINDGPVEGFAVWELGNGGAAPPISPSPRDVRHSLRRPPPPYRHRLPTHLPLPAQHTQQRATLQQDGRHPRAQTGTPLQQQRNNAATTDDARTACWTEISRTPQRFLKERNGALRRLNDSTLVCHGELVCMTGLIRHANSPWNCFYPWLLVYDVRQDRWDWSPHPLGSKTWAKFHPVCVLQPNLTTLTLQQLDAFVFSENSPPSSRSLPLSSSKGMKTHSKDMKNLACL